MSYTTSTDYSVLQAQFLAFEARTKDRNQENKSSPFFIFGVLMIRIILNQKDKLFFTADLNPTGAACRRAIAS
jgi:hypothetical protein